MMNNKNVKIYVCHHKPVPVYQTDCLVPIQVGASSLSGMISDNTGDNIADKNKSFAELTALYHLWKNVDVDYYGLFHYRRFLKMDLSAEGNHFRQFDEDTIQKFGWTDDAILSFVPQFDVIVPKNCHPYRREVPHHILTMCEHQALHHHSQDFEIVLNVIRHKYPEMYASCLNSLYSKGFIPCNMMIMKKSIFQAYCTWLFDIFFEAEKSIQIQDGHQQRVFGFLGEYLLSMYIRYLKEQFDDINILHTDIVMGDF